MDTFEAQRLACLQNVLYGLSMSGDLYLLSYKYDKFLLPIFHISYSRVWLADKISFSLVFSLKKSFALQRKRDATSFDACQNGA